MAHHSYITEGIVLKTQPWGEANMYVTIFTADFGIIKASVQGARVQKSKLRYGISEYTLGRFSFVRGLYNWKLTSAIPDKNYFFKMRGYPEKIDLMAKSALLMKRFFGHEDPHMLLYEMYKKYLDFLSEATLSKEALVYAEYICALRILRHLGYVGGPGSASFDAVHTDHWSEELVMGSSVFAKDMLRIINQSIKESHL